MNCDDVIMGDPDYLLALHLQKQFQHESNYSQCENESDLQFALTLQQQFQLEHEVEKPKGNLVYDQKAKPTKDNAKSLIDPSWEIIDPTPNIHTLFVSFNETFFWNKLLSVCVSWSKRMTSCAGICSYQGRGGLCSITLSEPLLKLRPRKDLVETLLHEMIHAYLFVTHNNRDRDGHGPEFHKHMNRINNETGTNITVYHTFYDEVRLYKQHWWRCDGACQHRRPFFGMVRRAMNRAPGPNDRWWAEHTATCGGKFIKVKEPEKKQKKQSENIKGTVVASPNNDIRKYMPVLKETTNTSVLNAPQKSKTNSKPIENTSPSNVFGFNMTNGRISNVINIGNKTNKVQNSTRNSSSTIVITKNVGNAKPHISKSPAVDTTATNDLNSANRESTTDYAAVRNHWLNKFPSSHKRHPSETETTNSKKMKPDEDIIVITDSDLPTKESVKCPVCHKNFSGDSINDHLDSCLNTLDNANVQDNCIHCDKLIPTLDMNAHVSKCLGKHFEEDFVEISSTDTSNCVMCNKNINTEDLNTHMQSCLLKSYGEIENKYSLPIPGSTSCLACGKRVEKAQLKSHLDVCMNNFDDMPAAPDDEFEDENTSIMHTFQSSCVDDDTSEEKTYGCPFCSKMFLEKDMNEHLDMCLIKNDDADNVEKSVLLDILFND